jgi:inhibitor of lysozyme (Ivy)
MTALRPMIAATFACFLATASFADQPYLYDLLKEKPYHAAWDAMLKGEKKIDRWIVTFGKTYDGVTDKVKTVAVDGQNDMLGWVCKPHDCGNNQLYLLFAPDAKAAWGMLVTDKTTRWLGAPGDSVQAALTAASKQQ